MSPLPTYPLSLIRQLIWEGRYRLTGSATLHASALGFTRAEVVNCIINLRARDFYKTMSSHRFPTLMQDVYRPRFEGHDLYVKLQIQSQPSGQLVMIISFKDL